MTIADASTQTYTDTVYIQPPNPHPFECTLEKDEKSCQNNAMLLGTSVSLVLRLNGQLNTVLQ